MLREAIFILALVAMIMFIVYLAPLVSMFVWFMVFVLMMWCHALKEFPDEPSSLFMRLKAFPDRAAYIVLPFISIVAHFFYLIN